MSQTVSTSITGSLAMVYSSAAVSRHCHFALAHHLAFLRSSRPGSALKRT